MFVENNTTFEDCDHLDLHPKPERHPELETTSINKEEWLNVLWSLQELETGVNTTEQ